MVLSISNSMYNIMMQYTISIASPPFTGVATALLVGIPVKKIIPSPRNLSTNKKQLLLRSCFLFSKGLEENFQPFLHNFYLAKLFVLPFCRTPPLHRWPGFGSGGCRTLDLAAWQGQRQTPLCGLQRVAAKKACSGRGG